MHSRVSFRESALRLVCRRVLGGSNGECNSLLSSSSIKEGGWINGGRVAEGTGEKREVWLPFSMTRAGMNNHSRLRVVLGLHSSSVYVAYPGADEGGRARGSGLDACAENWRHLTIGEDEQLPPPRQPQQRFLHSLLSAGSSTSTAAAGAAAAEVMHSSAASTCRVHPEQDPSFSSSSASFSSSSSLSSGTGARLNQVINVTWSSANPSVGRGRPSSPSAASGTAAQRTSTVGQQEGSPQIGQALVVGGAVCGGWRFVDRTTVTRQEGRRGLAVALPSAQPGSRHVHQLRMAEPKVVKVRVYMQSPGVIGEPYRRPAPPLPFVRRWLTREGWRRRGKEWMDTLRTAYTVARLRKESKGYRKAEFYRAASALYSEVNKAIVDGDRTTLRQLVTETAFTALKSEMKKREDAGWQRISWTLASVPNIRTAQARLVGFDAQDTRRSFAQITLLMRSKQKFAAYDRQGKLVAGDPDKEIDVEDCWVFERPLERPEQKWRLCGRLKL